VVAYVFNDILSRASDANIQQGTRRAKQWFRDQAKQVRTSPNMVMRPDDRSRLQTEMERSSIGRMYFFFYDPKGKRELPYYDRFPLIFMVGPAEGGFYGLNLHYLPPVFRARLMDSLYDTMNNDKYDETTRLRISYNILKRAAKFRYFKPCLKHYLDSKVQGRFLEVKPTEWDIALFLPVERFQKKNKNVVWRESRDMF